MTGKPSKTTCQLSSGMGCKLYPGIGCKLCPEWGVNFGPEYAPDSDKSAFTSIIALYQCNRELLKQFRKYRKDTSPNKERDKRSLEDYLKFRPDEVEIDLYKTYLFNFWESVKKSIQQIKDYISIDSKSSPALTFRNKKNGGSLLFRPVGILPFVQATIEISKRTNKSFDYVLNKLNSINFTISAVPWKNVLWNPSEKTMIMGTQTLVKLLIIHLYNPSLLTESELNGLLKKYSDKIGTTEKEGEKILDSLPITVTVRIRRKVKKS